MPLFGVKFVIFSPLQNKLLMGGHHTLLNPTSVPFQTMLRSAVYTTHIPCYHRCALPGFKDLISILSLYSAHEALCVAISLPAAVVDRSQMLSRNVSACSCLQKVSAACMSSVSCLWYRLGYVQLLPVLHKSVPSQDRGFANWLFEIGPEWDLHFFKKKSGWLVSWVLLVKLEWTSIRVFPFWEVTRIHVWLQFFVYTKHCLHSASVQLPWRWVYWFPICS